jgi:hypothetical protein
MLSSGATNLCSGSFCKTVTIQALSGINAGKKQYVTGTIEAKKDIEYLLSIDLVNYSGKAISGSSVTIEGTGLDINAFTVNGALQTENTATIGTIGIDSPLKLQIVFKSTNSGASAIKVTINSSTQTEFEATYNVNIKPNKTFTLEMIPKVIVPYLENTLFFEAIDGNTSLSGVLISIKSDKIVLGNVTTNGEGLAQYNLAAPKVGAILTIVAKKEGYNDVELVKQIDKSVLTIVPPKIEETMKIGEITALETQIILQNNTAKTIKLVSASINGELKSYLDVKFNDTINGTIIEQGKDKNYSLTFKLNSLASRLVEPKDVTGTIVINTEVSGANQAFLNEIPVEIRLTFPGMLDSGKCLKIAPTSIEFITTSTEVTKTITLTNNCTAEGIKVDLRKLEAKLNETSKFGTVSLIGAGLSGQLTDKYSALGDLLEKDSETELVVKYSPTTSVESGVQNLVISILGKNLLDDGTSEKVEATTKLNVTMNNLSKCIVVEEPVGGIILDMAPWSQGYGRLLASDYSSALSSYQGFNNRSAPYAMNYQNGMGMSSYGNQSYGMSGYNQSYNGLSNPSAMQGMQGGYGQMGGMQGGTGANTLGQNKAGYSQSAFTITNNCTSDMEINLDVDPRITVAENKFTLGAGSDSTVIVQPGYVLGKYTIKVNARLEGTKDAKKKIDDVSVTVRKLGDIDKDCIKTNVTRINLNSFIMKPQKYSAYNYCYDTGVQLARANVATINCSAPSGAGLQSMPYLQVGMESSYSSQYPLNATYSSYNSYSSGGGVCGNSQCSLINGTNIRQRTVDNGANGSIERVDFDVIPNPNYIPQRRLFNNQTGTAGLFQNLGDIRQWATETDARTDVYGNLNINYNNAYGIAECMEFPITITDFWRIGESIDSALNWGDPKARPIDCQRKGALDIISYWQSRNPISVSSSTPATPGTTNTAISASGVVPETEYTGSNKTIYKHIADPAALRIGPMPNNSSQIYPQATNQYYNPSTSYDSRYFNQQAALANPNMGASSTSDDASANCGLTDSIKVLTKIPAQLTGGASVSVETTHSGSLFKNSYGSNLMVEVDRSGMVANCVKLEIPIKAKVTRAITMETQELTWNLRILFTRQGYTYKGIENECMNVEQIDTLPIDCTDKLRTVLNAAGITTPTDSRINALVAKFLEENPLCAPYVSANIASQMLTTSVNIAGGCGTDTTEYGLDLISKTTLASYNKADMVDCTKYFCNDTMLQSFMLNRFAEIKAKVDTLGSGKNNVKSLTELYRASGTIKVKNCENGDFNFFKSANTLVNDVGKIPAELLPAEKVTSISDLTSPAALADMIAVLEGITAKDKNALLIEFNSSDEVNTVHITKVGAKMYMSINSYIGLLKTLKVEEEKGNSDCAIDNKTCNVTFCGTNINLGTDTAFKTIIHGKLVKGVIDQPHLLMNKADIELIYTQNPTLNAIHKLAKFDSELVASGINPSLLLTNITKLGESKNTQVWLNKTAELAGLNTNFINATNAQIGLYSAELDYDLEKETKTVNVTLGEKKAITKAPKAINNVLLKAGFNFTPAESQKAFTNSIKGTIVELTQGTASGVFYKRIPIKLTATLNGTETGLTYTPVQTAIARPSELIRWYNTNKIEIGTDRLSGTNYTISVKPTGQMQTISGIYYYPNGGELGISSGITGGTLSAKSVSTLVTYSSDNMTIPGKNQQGLAFQANPVSEKANTMTLDTVLELIKNKQACIQENSVVWDEKSFINAN